MKKYISITRKAYHNLKVLRGSEGNLSTKISQTKSGPTHKLLKQKAVLGLNHTHKKNSHDFLIPILYLWWM